MGTTEELLNEAYAAVSSGDADALLELCTPGVKLHIPGRGPQSGTYRGRPGARELVAKLGELTDGTMRVEVAEVVGDEPFAVVLGFVVAEKEGRTLDARVVHVWEIREGKLAQMWSHPADQYELDEFYTGGPVVDVVPVEDDEDEGVEVAEAPSPAAAEEEPAPTGAAFAEPEGPAEIEAAVDAAAGDARVIAFPGAGTADRAEEPAAEEPAETPEPPVRRRQPHFKLPESRRPVVAPPPVDEVPAPGEPEPPAEPEAGVTEEPEAAEP
ncbi:MAG: nuclear transport factor 2 family protein, partial [Actinomycetota bacterium]